MEMDLFCPTMLWCGSTTGPAAERPWPTRAESCRGCPPATGPGRIAVVGVGAGARMGDAVDAWCGCARGD